MGPHHLVAVHELHHTAALLDVEILDHAPPPVELGAAREPRGHVAPDERPAVVACGGAPRAAHKQWAVDEFVLLRSSCVRITTRWPVARCGTWRVPEAQAKR